jgi:hypothetical protein
MSGLILVIIAGAFALWWLRYELGRARIEKKRRDETAKAIAIIDRELERERRNGINQGVFGPGEDD